MPNPGTSGTLRRVGPWADGCVEGARCHLGQAMAAAPDVSIGGLRTRARFIHTVRRTSPPPTIMRRIAGLLATFFITRPAMKAGAVPIVASPAREMARDLPPRRTIAPGSS